MRWATATIVTLFLVGGCDLRPKVDQKKMEDALSAWLVDHDLVASDIHCPDNQVMENGNKFECTCKVHGTEVPVAVEVTDASTGSVEWKPKYHTMKGEEFAAEIRARPQFANHQLDVTCSDKVLVSIPDSKWTCEVVDKGDGGKKFTANVTFSDGDGTHSIDLNAQ